MKLDPESRRNALAWVFLVSAVAIHVLDEALADFLPFWNEMVTDARSSLGFFPMPTFTFGQWLAGLIAGVVIGYALTPLVARGGKVVRGFAMFIGVVMAGNGLGHLVGSWYFGAWLPGSMSSPLLLATAIYLLVRTFRGEWAT